MNKNEAESVIRETIEYANTEIKKNNKKTLRYAIIAVCAVLIIAALSMWAVRYETPVAYCEGLLEVSIPEDEGLDIQVNLKNYKNAKGILVKQDDAYDLYLGITQTPYTRMIKNDETNLVRAGNGIIVDYHSDTLIARMPGESVPESIMHVYYIDNLTDEIMCMEDSEIQKSVDKTLIWSR